MRIERRLRDRRRPWLDLSAFELTRKGRRLLIAICVVDWLVFMLALWLLER